VQFPVGPSEGLNPKEASYEGEEADQVQARSVGCAAPAPVAQVG